jgi:hypothetical protein
MSLCCDALLSTGTTLLLNEAYSRDRISKNTCDALPIHNGLKQGDALWSLLFNSCFRVNH